MFFLSATKKSIVVLSAESYLFFSFSFSPFIETTRARYDRIFVISFLKFRGNEVDRYTRSFVL